MKKLTIKQRQRQPKPRRKPASRGPTPPRRPGSFVDGWIVRLPDEPAPDAAEPGSAMFPTYVGWKGRARHIQMAVLFETRAAAQQVAAAFPAAEVQPCDIWSKDSPCQVGSWLTVAIPDPVERDAAFPDKLDPNDEAAVQAEKEFEKRLEAAMTIPDERAPQDPALEKRVIEWIHAHEPMTYQFTPKALEMMGMLGKGKG